MCLCRLDKRGSIVVERHILSGLRKGCQQYRPHSRRGTSSSFAIRGDRPMGRGRGGKGRGSWNGGGGGGGWSAGGNKPFWRRFVDPSEDPEVIEWCRQRVQSFLDSGETQQEIEWLGNEYRNTIRHLAPEMGAAWNKVSKGVYALVRSSAGDEDQSMLKRRLVEALRNACQESGGRCLARSAWFNLPQDLWAAASVELKMKNVKWLPEACREEMEEAGLRMNMKKTVLILGENDGYDDAVFVRFNAKRVSDARKALERALRKLPASKSAVRADYGVDFLRSAHRCMSAEDLERERASSRFQHMLATRSRLPAFKMAQRICSAIRQEQVTLILGATGCGKTTQVPQLVLEDVVSRGEPCRILASQPRRISAYSVADRVASERGGKLGDTVAYKIRFEDNITESTQLIFCTVGILLKVLQTNPRLDGATHIFVDEVHERDLHTDFLLTLLRGILNHRSDLKIILMSATVDPSAFQSYFPGVTTFSIPGKTNYPIQELFLEDILQALPDRSSWRQARAAARTKPSAFSQGPLHVPQDAHGIRAALPGLPMDVSNDLARVHACPPEDVDFDLAEMVVRMIHESGEEGGILMFMPGWFEIAEMVKRLQGFHQLDVHPLHSRQPTAEQQTIFRPPPPSKRKVIISTILAETSITVEDIVYVIDTGRTRSTFFNESSKVSALRTVWYSKANGFQRRGRSGRCRPGIWYRLFSSLQWESMDEYSLPEMLRSPLEELCLEVASLQLGAPIEFLAEAISPPKDEIVRHAVDLLYNLGAVSDRDGAILTPLGLQLSKLQVHPMLGKMLLLAGLFRCFDRVLTICASLGYKSPFLCPMGKEKEANQAKRELASNSKSDLIALANAYDGWCVGKTRFANQHFLSHQTMEYIHRLRQDLQNAARDILRNVPPDHSSSPYLADICRSVLVAGLFPNLAWIRKMGKGQTLQGLKVTVHPGSVNSTERDNVVVFYEIQETTDRWMYDTTVVSMAPVLLFAPDLEELHRGERVVFRVSGWDIAVDPSVADDLLALRSLLVDFISSSVGQTPTQVHVSATEALSKLLSEHVDLVAVDEEEEEDETGGKRQREANPVETVSDAHPSKLPKSENAFAVGDDIECYWPEDDDWLPAKILQVFKTGSFKIRWEADHSTSAVPASYVRKTRNAMGI